LLHPSSLQWAENFFIVLPEAWRRQASLARRLAELELWLKMGDGA
jgi:hypothetical protein